MALSPPPRYVLIQVALERKLKTATRFHQYPTDDSAWRCRHQSPTSGKFYISSFDPYIALSKSPERDTIELLREFNDRFFWRHASRSWYWRMRSQPCASKVSAERSRRFSSLTSYHIFHLKTAQEKFAGPLQQMASQLLTIKAPLIPPSR